MIDPISTIGTEAVAQAFAPDVARTAPDFGAWLTGQIASINDKVVGADAEVRRLALGEAGNLHEVMMRLENAKLSFELAVQVRNKLLEAYQEIMRMQI